jgi:hypothetical protein
MPPVIPEEYREYAEEFKKDNIEYYSKVQDRDIEWRFFYAETMIKRLED